MTDAEYARKLDELDRLLNDPDVPMEPEKVWSLLAEIAQRDGVAARGGTSSLSSTSFRRLCRRGFGAGFSAQTTPMHSRVPSDTATRLPGARSRPAGTR